LRGGRGCPLSNKVSGSVREVRGSVDEEPDSGVGSFNEAMSKLLTARRKRSNEFTGISLRQFRRFRFASPVDPPSVERGSGQSWIRTSEGVSQRIYSPPRLATSVSARFRRGRALYAARLLPQGLYPKICHHRRAGLLPSAAGCGGGGSFERSITLIERTSMRSAG
jgi:hypothetical protein